MAEHFLQGHTPANPCSQSGPLLFLPCRCGAPMGHANLAGHLLQPRVPHPGTVISSLFWSEHFLQEGSRMSSHPIRAPGSSMSCLLGAARGGGGGLQEPGAQKPGALSPGACGLSSCESSIYTPQPLGPQRQRCPGKCCGTTKSCSVVSRGQMGQRREVTGQQTWQSVPGLALPSERQITP